MTKSTYNPKYVEQFDRVIDYIVRFDKAALSRSQWSSLYPALLGLSERLSVLAHKQNGLFQWLLSTHIQNLAYAQSLRLKRIAIVAGLCRAHNYHRSDTQVMMMAALSADISVLSLLNKRHNGEALSSAERQRFSQSALLSLKMLSLSAEEQPALTQIIAKLKRYRREIISHQRAPLYDGYTRIVACASILAEQMTATRPLHLFNACAQLYKATHNVAIQQDCDTLVDFYSPQLLGSRQRFEENDYLYMGCHPDGQYIFTDAQATKSRFRLLANPHWQYRQPVRYRSWSSVSARASVPVQRASSAAGAQRDHDAIVAQIRGAQGYSDIEKVIAQDDTLVAQIMMQASQYNRGAQQASSLRHALSMVGLYSVGDFIARVMLEEKMLQLCHPMAQFLQARVHSAIRIVEDIARQTKDLQHERLSALLLCYFNFFIFECPQRLSRTIALNPLKTPMQQDIARPLATLLGVQQYDNEALRHYLTRHIGSNEWVNALLNSEQQPFDQLNSNARLCCTLKIILFYTFSGPATASAWQQQLVKQTMVDWQGPSTKIERLVDRALSCAPHNGI
ncbi:hypothetical protein W04_0134 [Pseudoalteromonas sp. SW0106-04]|uniref:hypothetical protein n=1 Tax=Pseudoalteromonas sp. SW0106-04 TaxID=1702169 RepID=UPI0006B695D8|nr:hypothetical protein [Pseudoalteromonas sp. SW0106-04]GAP73623.1 hypothetical protein W04_0134 [Pseudoalteromonas sp. SW0106-04]